MVSERLNPYKKQDHKKRDYALFKEAHSLDSQAFRVLGRPEIGHRASSNRWAEDLRAHAKQRRQSKMRTKAVALLKKADGLYWKIVLNWQNYCHSKSSRYQEGLRACEAEDIHAEGLINLYRAALRFKPDRRLSFSTYASSWMRVAFQRTVDKDSEIPSHAATVQRLMERIRIEHPHASETEVQMMTAECGARRSTIRQVVGRKPPISMDRQYSDDGPTTMHGLLVGDDESSIEDPIEHMERKDIVVGLILGESGNRKDVLEMIFVQGISEAQTAKRIKLTRQRINQIRQGFVSKASTLSTWEIVKARSRGRAARSTRASFA